MPYRYLNHFFVRNGLALTGLMLAMYLPDLHAIESRSNWDKLTPYFFAVLLYAWLVFHNRVLFERLFEKGRRREYFCWTLVLMLYCSFNITFSLHYLYDMAWPIPVLVKFYVFTFTGFGTYLAYRQFFIPKTVPPPSPDLPLTITVDGSEHKLAPDAILYIESLENYLRIFTDKSQMITRMTMKQAVDQLPPYFLRINRSCLVNLRHVRGQQGDELILDKANLRIGRTYKQLVSEQLKQNAFSEGG